MDFILALIVASISGVGSMGDTSSELEEQATESNRRNEATAIRRYCLVTLAPHL
tara:strand:+ start:456 stop:617 length:162 start_codon:yes stop_codon:yes gene_type:complete